MAPQVTLAPEPVQRGPLLWTWDGVLGKGFMLGAFPVRMVIAGYTLGGKTLLVVISPLDPTEAVVSWLKKTGMVTFVVAPNKHHCFWARAMKAALPGSLLAAPAGLAAAKPTLPVDVKVTPLAGVQDMPGSWPSDVIDVISVKGCKFLDELVFHHKPSATLVLTDTAFNFSRDDKTLGAAAKLYLSLGGGYRPCCMTGLFKMLIDDPAAMKESFDEILARWEFDQVSVAHGAFIASGGKAAFQAGSCAFVDTIVAAKQGQAAGAGGKGLVGTGAAVAVAAALISTAVGIGVAGIMRANQG